MSGQLVTATATVCAAAAAMAMLYGTILMVRLQRVGGLVRIFARAVVDATERQKLLRGVVAVNASFLAMGVSFTLSGFGVVPDTIGDLLSASFFVAGTSVLVYQIHSARRFMSLTLENEFDLRDYAPNILAQVTREDVGGVARGLAFSASTEPSTSFVPGSTEGLFWLSSEYPAP